MIDLNNLSQYRENNRIEAKKAQGGLPRSVWQTYSAFANTLGGYILFGLEELADKSLHPITLPAPEKLVAHFWDTVNNREKVSVNILTEKHVRIESMADKAIVIIEVPRAQRSDKPVYIGNNPMTGTYRRNGEGDYRCSKEQVLSMLRDAAVKTQDMTVLENISGSVFDTESVRRYRLRMRNYRPGHVWEKLDDNEFLFRLGAMARGEDGHLHPTGAGLLMFGFEYEIVQEFSHYFLDYRECLDTTTRWTDRIESSSGDWSGNLFDFYFRVYNRLAQDFKTPFRLEQGMNRIDDTPCHKAMREALANCLIHADYYGTRGVVIIRRPREITVENPGVFRIDINEAISGGASDPRNATLIKIFNLIGIGERAGSGVPSLFENWRQAGGQPPVITESFNPERTVLTFTMSMAGDNRKKPAITTGDIMGNVAITTGDKQTLSADTKRGLIIEFFYKHPSGTTGDICSLLGVKPSQAKHYLAELVAQGILAAEGANRNRRYRLKI